jgi:hypothetical protein
MNQEDAALVVHGLQEARTPGRMPSHDSAAAETASAALNRLLARLQGGRTFDEEDRFIWLQGLI